ncbi:MAG: extracellular solute-binding protein [Rhodospirillaceae bacterium]|nr:extracellular solute-binding protein [Rhodospirillaceae bacterium]
MIKHLPTVAVLAAAAVLAARPAAAESLDELAAKAAGEGEIVWYEANSAEMGDRIVAAFNKQFPKVKLRFQRIAGAQGITARIVQESEAKAATADVTTTGIDQIYGLNKRGLTESIDWSKYGVPKELTPTPYAVAATAAVWVIVYNKNKVSAADAPKSWDDLADPKWKGKLGIWAIGHSQANLAGEWGEAKTDAWMQKLVKQEPLLYKSNFTIAQNLASGEISVGITPLHVAQSTAAKGAPITIVAAEPTPMSMIYSAVIKGTKKPNGSRLLIAWLSSKEGALAYEQATKRGNPFLPFTATAQFLKGRKLATFKPDETDKLQALITKYTGMLRGAGAAR